MEKPSMDISPRILLLTKRMLKTVTEKNYICIPNLSLLLTKKGNCLPGNELTDERI